MLKALDIKQKGKLKKDKEGWENWIQISIKYKCWPISLEENLNYSLTEDYYYTLNLSTLAGKFTSGLYLRPVAWPRK